MRQKNTKNTNKRERFIDFFSNWREFSKLKKEPLREFRFKEELQVKKGSQEELSFLLDRFVASFLKKLKLAKIIMVAFLILVAIGFAIFQSSIMKYTLEEIKAMSWISTLVWVFYSLILLSFISIIVIQVIQFVYFVKYGKEKKRISNKENLKWKRFMRVIAYDE